MGRRAVWLGRLVLALLAVLAAPGAQARTLELGPLTCVGGAETAAAAAGLGTAALDCGEGRFAPRHRFVRTRTHLAGQFIAPPETLDWVADPGAFDALLLRFTFADGSVRIIDVDPQMAVRNWQAGNRFRVPVPAVASPLMAIDSVIERPRNAGPMLRGYLVEARSAARAHFRRSLVYALACGLLLLPALYSLFYWRALRGVFLVWHAGLSLALTSYVASNSGLVFLLAPELPLMARWFLNTTSFVAALVCGVFFALTLVERGVIGPRWRLALQLALVPPLLANFLLLADLEATRPVLNSLLLASFVPAVILLPAALISAVRRGSRMACYPLAGFGLVALGSVPVLAGNLFATGPSRFPADLLLAALLVMSIATSAGVGERFMMLRIRLSQERLRASELGALAFRDALTGLANRRAFDALATLEPGCGLLVADIDHFKRINDAMGHQMGDAVLCHAAQILRETLADRPGARLFRLGGEEFAIIDSCDSEDDLIQLAEQIRVAMEARSANPARNQPEVRISVGAVCGRGQCLREAFAAADAAMYRAKALGRNRIECAPSEP